MARFGHRAMAAAGDPAAGAGVRRRVGAYAELSKFGIVLLVLVSAGAGFMLAAPLGPEFHWRAGLGVLVGVMLLSSGASALNQVPQGVTPPAQLLTMPITFLPVGSALVCRSA